MERELEVAASKLLRRAAQAGVFLSYSHEKLHFKLAVEVFPPALKNEIVANKAALIALLKQREPADNRSSRIQPRVRETNELPTSFAQQRLWLVDQLGRGSPQYNMPDGLRVRGRFDEDIAERVLRRIIQRHEPLRTVFRSGAEGPLQHIRENFDFHLTRLDLSALPAEKQQQIVLETTRADALKPFDLSADLMLRASFVRLSEAEGVLLFNMHHIASDGWSMRILVKEFSELYHAFSKGQPDPLPPLKVQYADYAQWQREWLTGDVLERQLRYWEKQLADLPQVHGLPLDRSRPEVQTFNGAVHKCILDRTTVASLKQIARQEQVTLFMVLHGLFALLLSRHSNSHDIVIGTGVANRRQQELEPLVGFFVNMLVLRTDCRPGCTFREYLAHIKSVNLSAQANQDVPFEYLVERLKPQRSTSHAPLFQIAFNLNVVETTLARLPELEFTPLESGQVSVKFDLVLDAFELEDVFLNFTYNPDLFEETTIARLGEHFQNLARAVVANADELIERLTLLSESERRYLLYEVNETAADYPRESCLQELFEAQVELRPEAVAVVFADRQLSYRELNEQANQVAHYLRERGVGPDTLVGLCVERSLAMVVGLLGILKAGGAYVPLDPNYPAERLKQMMSDSAPLLVLTEELLEHRLSLSRVPRLRLDADKQLFSAYPRHNPLPNEVGLTSEHLAYLIYTSSSTGRPKGVMGLHRSTVNRLTWMWKAFPFVDSNVCCQQASLSSVDSVWEIFGPLLAGTRLVIIPTASVEDPEKPSKLNHWICSGKPIANTQVSILDENLQPVPIGMSGEIYVAGDNLGRGYWLDAELTAETFLPCPYSQSAGARMYRSGEFGRWLPDGSIERFGCNDLGNEEQTPTYIATGNASELNDNTQAVLLTAPAGLDPRLHTIVESLYQQHAPHIASPMIAESCVIETLPEDPDLHSDFIGERCEYHHQTVETTDGPLFRAVYLQAPDEGQSYLLLATHPRIADDVSWRMLLRDLDEFYRQLHAKGLIHFAAEESSYRQWGQARATKADSDDNHTARKSHEVPSRSGRRMLSLELNTEETAALLNDCTATYHAELNELLLAVVYLAVRQWTGESSVRIRLEEHGSEDLFPEIDVAEIVGCFITSDPLVIHNQDAVLATVIEAVKAQYRAAHRYGMGYGLISDAAHDELLSAAALIDAGALFNQQSDFSQSQTTVSVFAVAGEHKSCLTFEVAARVLRLRVDYDEGQYNEATMAALAHSTEEALRALIARQPQNAQKAHKAH